MRYLQHDPVNPVPVEIDPTEVAAIHETEWYPAVGSPEPLVVVTTFGRGDFIVRDTSPRSVARRLAQG